MYINRCVRKQLHFDTFLHTFASFAFRLNLKHQKMTATHLQIYHSVIQS